MTVKEMDRYLNCLDRVIEVAKDYGCPRLEDFHLMNRLDDIMNDWLSEACRRLDYDEIFGVLDEVYYSGLDRYFSIDGEYEFETIGDEDFENVKEELMDFLASKELLDDDDDDWDVPESEDGNPFTSLF